VVSVPVAQACGDLLELLSDVSEAGLIKVVTTRLRGVLALAAAAVTGMRGYTAITDWVTDVPPMVLADLYLRVGHDGG
jgi:hypothetical protein